jgi:MarR family transcriptional regulator, transcriptional regulator for hemolysin
LRPPLPTHELDAAPWLRVESTLMATARLVRDAYDTRLAPLDLGLTQALVLEYLSDFGPVTQTRIADHLHQGRAATGATVDRLHDRGLVKRRTDPDDRRVWLVELTATGRDLVGEITSVDEKLRTELRAGISRAERQALARLLERLRANLAGVIATGGS